MSLIARIYGLFSIVTNYFDSVDIIVMQNTAQLYHKSSKLYSFDLKGSEIGRYVKVNPKCKKLPLLKDINFTILNDSKIDQQLVTITDIDFQKV